MTVFSRHKINRPRSPRMNTGGWQFVYTGFILILLCFFIMLTSFSSLEDAKITRFTQAFSNAVNLFEGGRSLEQGETKINTNAMMVDKEDPMAMLFNKVMMQSRQVDLVNVNIKKTSRGVIITLADKLLFSSGQAKITSNAYLLMEKIGLIIKRIDAPVEIEGHSDDRPIRTSAFASNWELSTARAVNVLRYFIEKQKVDARRLSAVGFSKYQPVVKNDSEKNRARNRRVEIIFKANEKVAQ